MANNNVIERTNNLDRTIPVDPLGYLFTNETQAHQFVISCTRKGEKVNLTGSVDARFVNSQNEYFVVRGSIVDGNAVVTLHQDCYSIPGHFDLAIFVTSGTETTVVYAAVGTVKRTDSEEGVITGEPLPTLDELLDVVRDAQEIVSDFDDIKDEIDQEVDDLKSAVDPLYTTTQRVLTASLITNGFINSDGSTTGGKYFIRTKNIYYLSNTSIVRFTAPTGYAIKVFKYNASGVYLEPYGDADIRTTTATPSVRVSFNAGEGYRIMIGRFNNNDSDTYVTAEFAASILIYTDTVALVRYNEAQTLTDVQKAQALSNIGGASASDVTSISSDVANIQNDLLVMNQRTLTVTLITNGYIDPTTGETTGGAYYIRTKNIYYVSKKTKLVATAPEGYAIRVFIYNASGVYQSCLGVADNRQTDATQSVTVILPAGYGYRIMVGWFNNDSGSYVTAEFAASILLYNYTSYLEKLDDVTGETSSLLQYYRQMPVNTFGDILPATFKNKLLATNDDILIVCVGDSITGKIELCNPQTEPEHCPPGCQYVSWEYLIWETISKKRQICDRLDSQRDSVDVFTKVGTWEQIVNDKFTDAESNPYDQDKDPSVSALTYQSVSANASVQFVFSADTYDKCSIVYSLEPDGADCEIVISEGNGKMLVSADRTTWAEANGFTHTQNSNPDNLTPAQYHAIGLAVRQRHRRLWLKKADGVTGDITITYKKRSTQTLATNYMYCWGIERWAEVAVFVDNLGRSGRDTQKLLDNTNDIFARNPDLCLYEMPLANETRSAYGYDKAYTYYTKYFLSSDGNSYKTLSNDYANVPLIVMMPHGRGTSYDSANRAIFDTEHQKAGDPIADIFYRRLYGYVRSGLSQYANVACINIYDRMFNEALSTGKPYSNIFGGVGADAYTGDTVHLNQRGAYAYAKYLAPIFET